MKKLLTLAAAGLLGLAGAPQAAAYDTSVPVPPVSQLTSGKMYYIYDAHADDGTATEQTLGGYCRYGFRYDANDAAATEPVVVYGTHVKPANAAGQLDNRHVWTATQTADGTWTFQNVASQRYLANAEPKTTNDESARGYFDLETTNSAGVFKVKVHGTTNTRWDGNGGTTVDMVYYGGDGHPIQFYEAVAKGDGYELKADNAWYVTYSFPAHRGVEPTFVVTIADGENAAEYIPSVDFFTSTGLAVTGDAAIVSENQKNFTVNGSYNFPMEYEKVYRVKLKPDAAKNVKYNEADGFSKTHYTDATGEELAAEYLWYFKYSEFTTDGVLKVTMHSLKLEDSKGMTIGTADDSKATLTDAPTTFIVKPTLWGSKQEGDFCLKHPTDNNWINDRNPNFSTWANSASERDPGSTIRLSSLSESDFELLSINNTEEAVAAAKENPTQQNLRALFANYNFDDCNIIKNADDFAALGIAPSEAVNTWNTFRASIVNGEAFTAEQSESILPAYQALVSSSANTTGAHIKLSANVAPGDFMMGRLNNGYSFGVLGSDVNGNKTTWTLKPATGGFYLYNEYLAQYIQMPTEGLHNSAPAIPVASESEASVFVLDIFDAATARYGIKHVGTTDGYPYLHTNGTHALVRWAAQENSSWYLHASDEATANNEANIGADDDLVDASANCQIVGDGVGQYTADPAPDAAYLSACGQFLAITAASSNAEKHAAAAAVRAAYSADLTYTINMPQTGRFYRMRGERYLSSIETGARFDLIEDAVPNKVETIWYYDADKKFVAFANGRVISNCTGGNYVTVLSTHANASSVEFEACSSKGKYIVKVIDDATRYLYHANREHKLDGGNSHPGSQVGYHWIVEQVDMLPIPGSDKQYTAFYSPVVLKNKDADKMRANSVAVSLDNATASATAITGDVPANTPVLIEFTSEMERDANNGLVYLEIDYNAAAAQAEVTADPHFVGSIYATAKTEGTSYFTTQLQGEAVNFYALSEENVPGFASHIEVPTDQAAESYTISDPTSLGIEELDVDSRVASDVIYDLQGRRVSKAGRGLYIINGKKVLVR